MKQYFQSTFRILYIDPKSVEIKIEKEKLDPLQKYSLKKKNRSFTKIF